MHVQRKHHLQTCLTLVIVFIGILFCLIALGQFRAVKRTENGMIGWNSPNFQCTSSTLSYRESFGFFCLHEQVWLRWQAHLSQIRSISANKTEVYDRYPVDFSCDVSAVPVFYFSRRSEDSDWLICAARNFGADKPVAVDFKLNFSIPPCLIYNFGAEYGHLFENGIHQLLPECEVFAFGSYAEVQKSNEHFFIYKSFDLAGQNETLPLTALMAKLNHTTRFIGVLKLTSQSDLSAILPNLERSKFPVRIILMQVQQTKDDFNNTAFNENLLQLLFHEGYVIYHRGKQRCDKSGTREICRWNLCLIKLHTDFSFPGNSILSPSAAIESARNVCRSEAKDPAEIYSDTRVDPNAIDVVLPMEFDEWPLFVMQFFSLCQHLAQPSPFRKIFVVVPDSQADKIREGIKAIKCPNRRRIRYEVWSEHACLGMPRSWYWFGWYRQQYIKLEISHLVDTEFYLYIDADNILAWRNLTVGDMIIAGKAKHCWKPYCSQRRFFSSELLRVPVDGDYCPFSRATPQINYRKAAQLLRTRLEESHLESLESVLNRSCHYEIKWGEIWWTEAEVYILSVYWHGLIFDKHIMDQSDMCPTYQVDVAKEDYTHEFRQKVISDFRDIIHNRHAPIFINHQSNKHYDLMDQLDVYQHFFPALQRSNETLFMLTKQVIS
eukprot:gb/GEZN01003304.1/.p1 GENE.gb/GEZN01003304.1/~~gb/GEZN01003304.1/.p1  ORF type:complete len:663 (-),score=41.24 gb/GEZN01003304.1/:167-2155(-)